MSPRFDKERRGGIYPNEREVIGLSPGEGPIKKSRLAAREEQLPSGRGGEASVAKSPRVQGTGIMLEPILIETGTEPSQQFWLPN